MNRFHALPLACFLLLGAPLLLAQNPEIAGPADYPHRSEMRGREGHLPGMAMLPHGMWWKNPDTVKLLNITPDQGKQLDKILTDSRLQLIQMHAALEEEQLKLDPIMNASPFDQTRALAQISHIADLRADLEKTNAKMLVSLRAVLSTDQWNKLQVERRMRYQGKGFDGQRAPGSPNWRPGPDGGRDVPGGPPPVGQNIE